MILIRTLTLAIFLTLASRLVPAAEPQEFFQAFATATANVEQGKSREAAAALQAAGQRFVTTPWKEIALLKAAELEESFDRATATKNYEEILNRLKNQTSDRTCSIVLTQAGHGLQRLERIEIEAALQKYYLAKVEYPATLDALVAAGYVAGDKIHDASGRTYAYSTGVEKMIPSVPRQTYTLESIPAPPFGWKDAKIVGMSAGAALVQWTSAPSKSLRAGDKAGDLETLSVLDNGVILGNDARLVVLSAK